MFTGGDQPKTQKFYPGFVGGAFMTISGQKSFGLTIEATFSQKGAKAETDLLGETVTVEQRLNYLDVPIIGRYFFSAGSSAVRPNIFLGPTFNFLLNAKTSGGGADVTNTDSYNTFDFGVLGGIGVNVRTMPNQWLNFDLRYTQGITKILKDNNSNGTDNSTPYLYNGGFVLGVGYGFGI